jgi:uncharacterized protein YacL
MGKIGSGMLLGIILFVVVSINLPYDTNLIYLLIAFVVGFGIGMIKFITKIYDVIIESPQNVKVNQVKRVFVSIIIGIIITFIIGMKFLNTKVIFFSFILTYLISYSKQVHIQISYFLGWSKEIRTQNLAERKRLKTIEREEYAKERGRARAHGEGNKTIIHVHGGHSYSSEDGLKSPQELREGYKSSKARAEREYSQKESNMRDKIW